MCRYNPGFKKSPTREYCRDGDGGNNSQSRTTVFSVNEFVQGSTRHSFEHDLF